MNTLMHFDIAAALILLIILFTNIFRNMHRGTVNRFFNIYIMTTLIAAVGEAATVICQNCGADDTLLLVLKTITMLSHNFTTPALLMYIISLSHMWHKFRKHWHVSILLCLPYAATAGIIFINLFTGFMEHYENDVEIRSDAMWLLYIFATFYVVFITAYLICYRHLFKRHQIIALCAIYPLFAIAILVKMFFPDALIEIFSTAIGITIISTVIQRPENFIDSTTHLLKFTTYEDNIEKVFRTDNHVTVILFNGANYTSLYHILGFDGMQELLRKVAEQLNKLNDEFRTNARIYYLDRGRFRYVVDSYHADKVPEVAERIRDLLNERTTVNQIDVNLSSYICIARLPEDFSDLKSFLDFGVDFHRKAVEPGKVYWAEELFKDRNFVLLSQMDDIISRALANHSFKVYYQPIYSIKENRFVSAEALVRLIDDSYGFVPPNVFIPAAERNGAIHDIGNYVLDEVCRFIASDSFKRLGLEYIEVNLSAVQCMQRTLADDVLEIIKKHNISPSQINLEITESAAAYNQSAMEENMLALTQAGISFSLDDFGTGYSNMDRLTTLPLKIVKLDRTFVNNSQPRMTIFLRNIIRTFKDMELEIVVEGIETEQMVQRFSELNCDFIQGYYYSKPIPEEQFVEFIQKMNIA